VNHKKILSTNIYGLFAGDRILEINGKRLVDVTHRQAVEIINDAPKTCMYVTQSSPSSTNG
jgi:C-terminal processing protease CtpA/Prc